MRIVSLLFVLVLVLSCVFCSGVLATSVPFIFCEGGLLAANYPVLSSNDLLDVWYLEAPVFEGNYGPLFGYVGGFHVAIGFRDRNSGINYTIDYQAYAEVVNATIPWIVQLPNGTQELYWNNRGAICVRPFINDTYWSHKMTFMTTISGNMFNQYLQWIQPYNVTNSVYEVWTVYPSWTATTPWFQSTDCDTFAWDTWRFLYNLGATYDPDLVARHTRVCLYTQEPQLVNLTDPVWRSKVFDFYAQFHQKNASTITDIIKILLDVVELDKFVYYHGNYYQVTFELPFFAIRYDPDPVLSSTTPPQQKISTS